jgi:broad specificity phosphatase PhoE
MARIYMVRHGEAASGFDAHHDPELSPLGRTQAQAAAQTLGALGPMALISSPLRRARETAMPLEALWSQTARIEPAVAEIPSPTTDLAHRGVWLKGIMAGTWAESGAEPQAWKAEVIRCLTGMSQDCVIFSHFIAINVGVSEALGDPRIVCFMPDNASITIFETDGKSLTLIEKGKERATLVG